MSDALPFRVTANAYRLRLISLRACRWQSFHRTIATSSQNILSMARSTTSEMSLRKWSKHSDNGAVSDGSDNNPDSKRIISRLLSTLLGHEAALELLSKSGQGDVASEIATVFGRIAEMTSIMNNIDHLHIWSSEKPPTLTFGAPYLT